MPIDRRETFRCDALSCQVERVVEDRTLPLGWSVQNWTVSGSATGRTVVFDVVLCPAHTWDDSLEGLAAIDDAVFDAIRQRRWAIIMAARYKRATDA